METKVITYTVRGVSALIGLIAVYWFFELLGGVIAAARGSGWGVSEAITIVIGLALISFLGWVALGLWHEHNKARFGAIVLSCILILGGLLTAIFAAVASHQLTECMSVAGSEPAVPQCAGLFQKSDMTWSLLVAVLGGVLLYLFAFNKDIKARFDPSVAVPVVSAVQQDVQVTQTPPQVKL